MTDWTQLQVTLTRDDLDDMMLLQQRMLAALPDKRWYFSSDREEFGAECDAGRASGIRVKGRLAAFAIACPARLEPHKSYARKLGLDEPNSLDFQDIMVDPDFRRQGIHSHFLALFERQARSEGMTAMFCTVDPDNKPSYASFEKAGWQRVRVQSAYDGRIRAYYRKGL